MFLYFPSGVQVNATRGVPVWFHCRTWPIHLHRRCVTYSLLVLLCISYPYITVVLICLELNLVLTILLLSGFQLTNHFAHSPLPGVGCHFCLNIRRISLSVNSHFPANLWCLSYTVHGPHVAAAHPKRICVASQRPCQRAGILRR